ncbi:protein of unknown function [Tistlia consotensis]|uniref:DUF3576 domain-containing protein n=1 Tax=Tistlia consotensis USBA 355 TaxID=560819 RepID=A0A1Y6BL57_9PROT|nr:protein of unknown function [Tistlia consotensis USBA 355]SNR34809.1 protein of unknown function [Tistlia consotensis]
MVYHRSPLGPPRDGRWAVTDKRAIRPVDFKSPFSRSAGKRSRLCWPALRWTAVLLLSATVAACSAADSNTAYPQSKPGKGGGATYKQQESLFGPGGLNLFGGGKDQPTPDSGGTGIGVNAFLWRASLDTLSFMPLASADPFGGVIITEWYSPPQSPKERFKVNVFILGRELRADGVRASIFRQVRDETGAWADAPSSEDSNTEMENAILTRARQLRIAQAG